MNRIYKVLFNKALGVYGAVSELASRKSCNGTSQSVGSSVRFPLLVAGMLALNPLTVYADYTPITVDDSQTLIDYEFIGETKTLWRDTVPVNKGQSAITVTQDGDLTVLNGKFSNNGLGNLDWGAREGGYGASINNSGELAISSTTFTGNIGDTAGGGNLQ